MNSEMSVAVAQCLHGIVARLSTMTRIEFLTCLIDLKRSIEDGRFPGSKLSDALYVEEYIRRAYEGTFDNIPPVYRIASNYVSWAGQPSIVGKRSVTEVIERGAIAPGCFNRIANFIAGMDDAAQGDDFVFELRVIRTKLNDVGKQVVETMLYHAPQLEPVVERSEVPQQTDNESVADESDSDSSGSGRVSPATEQQQAADTNIRNIDSVETPPRPTVEGAEQEPLYDGEAEQSDENVLEGMEINTDAKVTELMNLVGADEPGVVLKSGVERLAVKASEDCLNSISEVVSASMEYLKTHVDNNADGAAATGEPVVADPDQLVVEETLDQIINFIDQTTEKIDVVETSLKSLRGGGDVEPAVKAIIDTLGAGLPTTEVAANVVNQFVEHSKLEAAQAALVVANDAGHVDWNTVVDGEYVPTAPALKSTSLILDVANKDTKINCFFPFETKEADSPANGDDKLQSRKEEGDVSESESDLSAIEEDDEAVQPEGTVSSDKGDVEESEDQPMSIMDEEGLSSDEDDPESEKPAITSILGKKVNIVLDSNVNSLEVSTVAPPQETKSEEVEEDHISGDSDEEGAQFDKQIDIDLEPRACGVIETFGDILKEKEGYVFQCVSHDADDKRAMSKGVAVGFIQLGEEHGVDVREQLALKLRGKPFRPSGHIIRLNEDLAIVCLVTKPKFNSQHPRQGKAARYPTISTVERALMDVLPCIPEDAKLKTVALGTGLDRLDYSEVIRMLERVARKEGRTIEVFRMTPVQVSEPKSTESHTSKLFETIIDEKKARYKTSSATGVEEVLIVRSDGLITLNGSVHLILCKTGGRIPNGICPNGKSVVDSGLTMVRTPDGYPCGILGLNSMSGLRWESNRYIKELNVQEYTNLVVYVSGVYEERFTYGRLLDFAKDRKLRLTIVLESQYFSRHVDFIVTSHTYGNWRREDRASVIPHLLSLEPHEAKPNLNGASLTSLERKVYYALGIKEYLGVGLDLSCPEKMVDTLKALALTFNVNISLHRIGRGDRVIADIIANETRSIATFMMMNSDMVGVYLVEDSLANLAKGGLRRLHRSMQVPVKRVPTERVETNMFKLGMCHSYGPIWGQSTQNAYPRPEESHEWPGVVSEMEFESRIHRGTVSEIADRLPANYYSLMEFDAPGLPMMCLPRRLMEEIKTMTQVDVECIDILNGSEPEQKFTSKSSAVMIFRSKTSDGLVKRILVVGLKGIVAPVAWITMDKSGKLSWNGFSSIVLTNNCWKEMILSENANNIVITTAAVNDIAYLGAFAPKKIKLREGPDARFRISGVIACAPVQQGFYDSWRPGPRPGTVLSGCGCVRKRDEHRAGMELCALDYLNE